MGRRGGEEGTMGEERRNAGEVEEREVRERCRKGKKMRDEGKKEVELRLYIYIKKTKDGDRDKQITKKEKVNRDMD